MRLIRAVAAKVLLATLALAPAAPAHADATCAPSAPGPVPTGTPWAQVRYDLRQLSVIADGHGITVAVVDSGVDAAAPQSAAAVAGGMDLLTPGGTGQRDCVGHGTAVASIIAAAPMAGVDFVGLAPKARILPYRVTEREIVDGRPQGQEGSTDAVARAVRDAADHAQVINLSLTQSTNDPRLRAAVAYAVSRDVVVVAAVGNAHHADGIDPPSYPAAYPGVIGVGAVDENGVRVAQSQVGPYVCVVAPGADVTVAARGRGLTTASGTSFAAPFVSATAALIRQYHPGIHADQVAARIVATTDPAPGGRPDPGYGYGILNPYRAVTENLPTGALNRGTAGGGAASPLPPAGARVVALSPAGRTTPLLLAAGAVLLALLILGAATVVPRGAARHWRPGPN